MSRALTRVHFVSPAVVAQTIARHGLRGILTQSEQSTFDAFAVNTRRRDWLAGRVAAKRALRGVMRECKQPTAPYSAIEIWNDADAAPRFTVASLFRHREFNISIAHADGAAVAGIAETTRAGTIGVDIEPTKPLAAKLLERVLHAAELERLASDGDHPAPLALWTAKEAVMKATHSVSVALRDVELSWRNGRDIEARVMRDGRHATRIRVRHREVGAYTIAVALWQ